MKALSIRQPWAWLILNADKDVENRVWPTMFRGRFLLHASKGMTREEYEDGLDTLDRIGTHATLPPFEILERGGLIGTAVLVDCVQHSESPWFVGPYGFLLRDVMPQPFRPFKGMLGFFDVPSGDEDT